MQTDLATAQSLAKLIPGAVVEPVSQAGWLGPFPAPQEYKIVLPSGAQIDAGGLAYSIQSSPDVDPRAIVQGMARTQLYEQGYGLAESSALAQKDVYGGVLPWVVPQGSTAYAGVPVLSPAQASTVVSQTPTVTQQAATIVSQQQTTTGTAGVTQKQTTTGRSGVTQQQEGVRQMSTHDSIVAMAAEHGVVGKATPDVWGWFYQQVTGSAAPAPELLGYQRAADLSLPEVPFDEWWTKVQAALAGQVVTSTPSPGGGTAPPPAETKPGQPSPPVQTPGPGLDWTRQNMGIWLIVIVAVILIWLLTR